MNYTIHREPIEYTIELQSDGRRWLAEVTETADHDLLVEVHELAEPPAHVNEADILTRAVGSWPMPLRSTPDDVATEVIRCLTLTRAA